MPCLAERDDRGMAQSENDGIDTMAELRSFAPDVPIIAIDKPFTPTEVLAVVRRAFKEAK